MTIFEIVLPYLALCGGVLLEGESFLVAAAISAHFGYMNIYLIIILTIICTQLSDWFWFLTGRKKGRYLLLKRPGLMKKVEFIYKFIELYPRQLMFLYRFIYGFRSIMPLVLGTSKVKVVQFLIFGLSSTIIWSSTIAFLGYSFGSVLQGQLKIMKQHMLPIFIIMLAVAIGIGILIRKKRQRKSMENEIQVV